MPVRRSAIIALSAIPLLLSAFAAQAANLVTNGGFESIGGTAPTTCVCNKTTFSNAAPTDWTIGNGGLEYVAAPGTADNGGYLSVYSPFPSTSPNGGNFVEADGDPSYAQTFSQSIGGLTIGKSYLLTFYQAAGQQAGFTGPTTEWWGVTFGGSTQTSPVFSLAQGGVGQWQAVAMTFVASAVTETLSFLAHGTPNGAPPISFLDGVSLTQVPEPASLGLIVVGILGIGVARLRRRAKRSPAV
jgi:PEP-CTERM motif